jgi:hypothetical protein
MCVYGLLLSAQSPFVQYYAMFFLAYELSTPFVNFHCALSLSLSPRAHLPALFALDVLYALQRAQ